MLKNFLLFGLLVTANTAAAQTSLDMCTRLAETITAGQSNFFTEQNVKALQRYVTCEASQSSSDGALGIAVKAFNLSGSFNQEQKKQMCGSDLKTLDIDVTKYQSAKVVFTETLPVIEACLKAATRSWNIEVARIHQDAISMSIANMQPNGGRLDYIDIIPPNAMSCTPMPSFPQTLYSSGITLTCIRNPTSVTFEGVTFTSSPDVTVNLRLAEAPFPIKLAGYRTSAFDALRQDMATLKSDITRLRGGMTEWSSTPAALGEQVGTGDPRPATTCPQGQYAIGINWWGAGGNACRGCLSAIQVICRTINAK